MTAYEPNEVPARPVWALLALVALLVGGSLVGVGLLVGALGGVPSLSRPMPEGASAPPGVDEDREAVETIERELHAPPGWIDRDRGRVRIPIERAMEEFP